MDGPAGDPTNDPVLFPDDDEIDEFEAPLAANAENKALHKEVKQLQRALLEIESEIEANDERVSAMQNHMKNVENEVKVVQNVSLAREKEIDTEERLAILAERETKALEKNAKKLQSQIEANVVVQSTLQNQIFMLQQEMDAIREQMKWDEEQLAEWLENARLREEDAEVIRKYEQADVARVKELTLELERLNTAVERAERQLDAEVTNTRSHRLGLDKVSLLFKDAHKERTEVIEQWEGTVARMEKEDNEIEEAAARFQALKAEATAAKLAVSEQQDFLEDQNQANREALSSLDKHERGVAQLEKAREAAAAQADRFQSELDSLRNVVSRTTLDERRQVQEFESLQEEYTKKTRQLDAAVRENEKLEEKLEKNAKTALSKEEQAAALERQLVEEQAYTKEVETQLATVSQALARIAQKNHELRSARSAIESETNGNAQADKNLSSNLLSAERQLVHQGQLMYKQDFQLAVLERKLLKLEGTSDEGEADAQKALQAEVDNLTEILAQHTETQKLLRSQLRRLQDDGRIARKRRDVLASEKRSQDQRLAEIELYNTGATKELETVVEAKQNMMVDENLLKLTLRRLRKQLDTKADDVHSLEQRKQELKSAMQERMQEIKVHKELLMVQRAEVNREKSRVAKELSERSVRIEQLKKRHDIVSFSMKGSTDESGEEHSEAYMMVKAAQEREELQQKGDALDVQIRKQEKELRMLDQTLQMMNGHNSKYKDSLRRANGESDDMAMKEHLEGQLRTALDKFKHKRRELRIKEQEREEEEIKAQDVEEKLAPARRDLAVLDATILNLTREMDDQSAKLRRAQQQAQTIIKTFRKLAGDPNVETVAEKDYRLTDLKDFTGKIMEDIDAIVAEVPDLRPEISLLYSSNGIERIPRKSVGGGGSSRSSASSVSRLSSRASSKPGSSIRGSSKASSRISSSRPGTNSRTKPQTSNAATTGRASVVTPRTIDLGIQGTGKR